MNILITGASRGIGGAAFDLLRSTGHNVAGHSTRGGDELIAGDFTDPARPRSIWNAALERLGGRIDVLVNNAGIYEGVADDAARRRLACRLGTHDGDQPPGAGRPQPPRHRPLPRQMAAAESSTSPAAPPIAATARSTGIMPRPRPASSA